jgi:hypothetical protein
VDVELVTLPPIPAALPQPVPQPMPVPGPAAKKGRMVLTWRDWVLLGVGAAAVIGAVGIGWLLALIFAQN